MSFYRQKRVLVTGGTGMIGRPLVELLLRAGAEVRVASLDRPELAHPEAEFRRANLLYLDQCLDVCAGMDLVFQVAGIKGSPRMTAEKPASFFVPLLMMNTNMMEAARHQGASRYLFASSVGVYSPAEIFHEDDVWRTFPSDNDRFAGWAKRMGELQAQAYAIEHGWQEIAIVRPANVYGPYDNFDEHNAMVIPSLIKRALGGEDPFVVWGDGSAVRDFIHAKDVARGMMMALEELPPGPVNLGSGGEGVSIGQLVEIILGNLPHRPEVRWDTSKPTGDKRRLLDAQRAKAMGFAPRISMEEGIQDVMAWYQGGQPEQGGRYNVFKRQSLL